MPARGLSAPSSKTHHEVKKALSLRAERILVVEDDPKLARLLSQELGYEGFAVRVAGTGGEALLAAEEQDYAVILLDLNLPDFDGVEVAERLQGRTGASIVMLTARNDVKQRIAGLEAGAADYLVKPISIQELVARLRARLREKATPEILSYGDLELNLRTLACAVGGMPLVLTRREFELLTLFVGHRGRVFSKEDLEGRLYADEFRNSNTIEVFVSRLRTKLAEVGLPSVIQTVRGLGYVVP